MAVLLAGHEEVLVQAVAREGDRRDAEAREGALEAVEAGEAARVAPRFAVEGRGLAMLDHGWVCPLID